MHSPSVMLKTNTSFAVFCHTLSFKYVNTQLLEDLNTILMSNEQRRDDEQIRSMVLFRKALRLKYTAPCMDLVLTELE